MQLFRNETKEWYHVFVDGEEIICTGGHPFYVVNVADNRKRICFENKAFDATGKWITAKDLKILDKVLLSDGSYGIITTISIEKLSTPETTYNLEVEDFHTYYVSDSRVLVHNDCRSKAVKKAWEQEKQRALNGEKLSREWTPDEITELKATGKVKGYEGHHMKSVKGYPELVGDLDNIQFLTRKEHFKAHNYNWRNITHGRYIGG